MYTELTAAGLTLRTKISWLDTSDQASAKVDLTFTNVELQMSDNYHVCIDLLHI